MTLVCLLLRLLDEMVLLWVVLMVLVMRDSLVFAELGAPVLKPNL